MKSKWEWVLLVAIFIQAGIVYGLIRSREARWVSAPVGVVCGGAWVLAVNANRKARRL